MQLGSQGGIDKQTIDDFASRQTSAPLIALPNSPGHVAAARRLNWINLFAGRLD